MEIGILTSSHQHLNIQLLVTLFIGMTPHFMIRVHKFFLPFPERFVELVSPLFYPLLVVTFWVDRLACNNLASILEASWKTCSSKEIRKSYESFLMLGRELEMNLMHMVSMGYCTSILMKSLLKTSMNCWAVLPRSC